LTTTVSEESEAGSPCQSCRRDKSSCREGDVGGDGGEGGAATPTLEYRE
jgi:GTPase involved in cell partitioning and DNA repair